MRRRDTVVRLYPEHPLLIVSSPTGIFYENQVGGHSCDQQKMEGFAVPLRDPYIGLTPAPQVLASFVRTEKHGEQLLSWIRFSDALRHAILKKYGKECDSGIDSEMANEIDALMHLDQASESACISVDRTKLEQCQEAWIYVNGLGQYELENLGTFSGVLTWFNSD